MGHVPAVLSFVMPAKKNPAPLPVRGFVESWRSVAYAPVRPALVGEVISTRTRSEATSRAGSGAAISSVFAVVWRCNMDARKTCVECRVKRSSGKILLTCVTVSGATELACPLAWNGIRTHFFDVARKPCASAVSAFPRRRGKARPSRPEKAGSLHGMNLDSRLRHRLAGGRHHALRGSAGDARVTHGVAMGELNEWGCWPSAVGIFK